MGTNVPAPLISSDASGATDTRKPLAELTVCDVWVCGCVRCVTRILIIFAWGGGESGEEG